MYVPPHSESDSDPSPLSKTSESFGQWWPPDADVRLALKRKKRKKDRLAATSFRPQSHRMKERSGRSAITISLSPQTLWGVLEYNERNLSGSPLVLLPNALKESRLWQIALSRKQMKKDILDATCFQPQSPRIKERNGRSAIMISPNIVGGIIRQWEEFIWLPTSALSNALKEIRWWQIALTRKQRKKDGLDATSFGLNPKEWKKEVADHCDQDSWSAFCPKYCGVY